jgi:hypothetical protein
MAALTHTFNKRPILSFSPKFRLKISEIFPNTGHAERQYADCPLVSDGKDFTYLCVQNDFNDEM